MKNPLFENAHPFTKLLFFSFIIFVSLSVVILLSLVVDSENIQSQKLLIAIQHLFIFIIPALIAAYIFSNSAKDYLSFQKSKPELYILAGLIILTAIPLINYTGMLNAKLDLPESLSGLEESIKKLEEAAELTTKNFLNVSSPLGLLMNLIIIALLPAIGEEIFFRGVLLNIFKDWTKNIHIAILLSSILFSAIHFQFYGFLPRLLLGMLFAYLLIWSGSIWLPILAHFINNALAVLVYYFIKDKNVLENTDLFGAEPSSYVFLIVSTIVLILFLILYYKVGKSKNFNLL